MWPSLGKKIFLALCVLGMMLAFASFAQAQGDGPRVHLPAPVGIQPLSLTVMDMDSSLNFAGSILIPDGGIDASIWALNYNRFFNVGGHLAELWVTGIGGSLDGSVTLEDGTQLATSASGFSDPYVAFKIGLFGAPALTPQEFAGHQHGIAIYALAGLTLPWGDYNANEAFNLGTNRWSLRFGLPMTVPFGSKGATWLEVHPGVYFFGSNDEPFRADSRSQDELYMLESHLSQNFTTKFWASLDLRYQYGGETSTDGAPDGNQIDQWGGGASLGYSFSREWSGFLGYGKIFGGNDDANGEMWRARLIFVF